MPHELLIELLVVTAAALVSMIGVMLAVFAARFAGRMSLAMTLGAGLVLIAVGVLDLAPEALRDGGPAALLIVVGFLAGVAIEGVLRRSHSHGDGQRLKAAAWFGLALLSAHSALDGALYAITFRHGEDVGLLTGFGLMLHEAPEGVAAVMLCLRAGLSPLRSLAPAIFASSLTTPMGWVLARAIGETARPVTEALFAATVGLILYVGAHLTLEAARAISRSPRSGRP